MMTTQQIEAYLGTKAMLGNQGPTLAKAVKELLDHAVEAPRDFTETHTSRFAPQSESEKTDDSYTRGVQDGAVSAIATVASIVAGKKPPHASEALTEAAESLVGGILDTLVNAANDPEAYHGQPWALEAVDQIAKKTRDHILNGLEKRVDRPEDAEIARAAKLEVLNQVAEAIENATEEVKGPAIKAFGKKIGGLVREFPFE